MSITISQEALIANLTAIWQIYIGTDTAQHPYIRLHSIEQASGFFLGYSIMFDTTDAGSLCYWLYDSAMAIRQNLIEQMAQQGLHYPTHSHIQRANA